ncbi:uncharacterized protein [Solanum tuberosum]|uniref:uncharacterized protein n=1 Tax=Solanum tuberosum TaxID=4113 RepID=UPI00073A1B05|nr:PREDICTED: uncharacterized protein LOC107063393 [Solanum tuberosum]
MTFQAGEQVLLKVSSMKGVMRFDKKGKFSPRYIGPLEILDCVGPVAYRLTLPPILSGVHPVFHASMLKKYHGDGDYIRKWNSVLLNKDLQYEEEPIAILDRDVRKLRTKEIKFYRKPSSLEELRSPTKLLRSSPRNAQKLRLISSTTSSG